MQLITNMLFLQSHFSLKKGAAALGIGTDSVILIKCDERWAWICNPLISNLQIPYIYIPFNLKTGDNHRGRKPGSFLATTIHCSLHRLLPGVTGWCPSMPWSLPWALTESEHLLNLSKILHQDGAQGHSSIPTTWSLIYGVVIILGTLDGMYLME